MVHRATLAAILAVMVASLAGLNGASAGAGTVQRPAAAEGGQGVRAVPPTGRSWLSKRAAQHYMRVAIKRRFRTAWFLGELRTIRCRNRTSIDSIRCRVIRWRNGRMTYRGAGYIWFSYAPRGTWWNYSYRIKRVNRACVDAGYPRRRCVRLYVVK